MKKFNISTVVLAVGLAFSASAMAATMSKQEYKSIGSGIDADYKAAKAQCDSLAGNAKDICVANAKGQESFAKAELEYKYKPTVKNLYEARIAKADAEYAVANEKCDDKAGNDKDVCVKEAKAAKVHAEADAKAKMTTAKAGAVADEKSIEANTKAIEKATDANKSAAADMKDADYAVAKEKCDVLAGDAKDRCISDAKVHFGKN